MKNLFFEIKNYLIVLSLFIFLFLALIFFPPIPDGALGSDYEQKEVTREKFYLQIIDCCRCLKLKEQFKCLRLRKTILY